jgi:hypothetical protein
VLAVLAPAFALADAGPTASFTWAPATPAAGEVVTLTSTSTPGAPDSPIAATLWDFDGNGVFDALGASVTTTFAAPGAQAVALQVVDSNGKSDTVTETVPVGPPLPPPPPKPIAPAAAAAPAPAPARALALMSPFPVVRIQGRVLRRGIVVTRLTVLAPSGALVRATCRGARRGCPRRTVFARSQSAAVPVRLRALERRLRPGAVVQVYVTAPGAIGKYTRFRVRRGGPPVRSDLCVVPAAAAPSACPGA